MDEQGNKLKDPKDGEHPDNEGDDVPGYTLIHIKKDADGNIVNVYRKTPEKPVEKPKKTTWVDEQGNKLKDPKDGEHPDNEGDDVPGYKLVRIDKDKDGNIVNVYQKIETPKTPTPQAKELPNTGDAATLTALLGLASLIGGFGTLPRKKRD